MFLYYNLILRAILRLRQTNSTYTNTLQKAVFTKQHNVLDVSIFQLTWLKAQNYLLITN